MREKMGVVIPATYLFVVAAAAIAVFSPGINMEGTYALLTTAPWSVLTVIVVDSVNPTLHTSVLINVLMISVSALINALLLYRGVSGAYDVPDIAKKQ